MKYLQNLDQAFQGRIKLLSNFHQDFWSFYEAWKALKTLEKL